MSAKNHLRVQGRSQIEVTDIVKKTAAEFGEIAEAKDLIWLRDFLLHKINILPYDETTQAHEASIRWKRTASEILEDGYVYDTKYCTDVVIVYCALCRAMGLETRFLKLIRKDGNATHSIAEIKLPEGWYFFDVAIRNTEPSLGELDEYSEYKVWKLWGKDKDAWSLGLKKKKSISKLWNG